MLSLPPPPAATLTFDAVSAVGWSMTLPSEAGGVQATPAGTAGGAGVDEGDRPGQVATAHVDGVVAAAGAADGVVAGAAEDQVAVVSSEPPPMLSSPLRP